MTDIDELIKNQICPPWIMKSKPILGRCVPSITEEEFDDSDISDKETVSWDSLQENVKSLANLMGLRDIGTKVFNDLKNQWWTILVGLILAMVVSFIWIILMR